MKHDTKTLLIGAVLLALLLIWSTDSGAAIVMLLVAGVVAANWLHPKR